MSDSEKKSPILAFFDLDLTLLEINSASLWVKSEYKSGRLSHWHLVQAMYWLTLYHLGARQLEKALLSGIRTLKGQDEQEFKERVKDFYQEQVAHRLRPGAIQVIKEHQKKGDLCYLMTNASAPLSALFVQALNLDGMVCNHFASDQGILTGEIQGELCFGSGKLRQATKLMEKYGSHLEQASFYSDSHSDLPLLEAVGYPYVVHPDRRLKVVADQRQWPILDWS